MPQQKSNSVRILQAKYKNKSPKKTMLHLLIGFIAGVIFCVVFIFLTANRSPTSIAHPRLDYPLNSLPNTPSGSSNRAVEVQTSHQYLNQLNQQPNDAHPFQTMPQPTPVNNTELSHLFKHPSATVKPVEAIEISPFQQIQQQQAKNKTVRPKQTQTQTQTQTQNNSANHLRAETPQNNRKVIENTGIATEVSDSPTIDKTPPVKILITVKPKEN